jgi:hypothetical protein
MTGSRVYTEDQRCKFSAVVADSMCEAVLFGWECDGWVTTAGPGLHGTLSDSCLVTPCFQRCVEI